MKKILFAVTLLLTLSAGTVFAQNGCGANISNFETHISFPGNATTSGHINFNYTVDGNANKAVEIIVNGVSSWGLVSGSGSIHLEVPNLAQGSMFTVTVNSYSSAKPEKGKLCTSLTASPLPVPIQ